MLSAAAAAVAVVLLTAIFTAKLALDYWLRLNTDSGNKRLPPGSFGWPIVGETLLYFRALRGGKPESFIAERMDKYDGRVFKTRMFGHPTAVFCGTAGNKFLFGNENKLVRLWWPPSVHKLFGRCISTVAQPAEAKRMRKILSSFLDPDALIKYTKTMDLVTIHHIKSLWQGKDKVTVYPITKLYTFELACRLFLSLQDSQLISKLSAQFNVFLKGVINIPLDFPGTRFHRSMRAADAIRKDLRGILSQRKLALEEKTASPSQDLLSHLLITSDEDGRFLTESEIVNNILLLLFASHDTSCSLITLVIKYLAELPQVYDQVLAEQMEIANSKSGELLEWEDVQKMKFTWHVVSEVTRLTPPVPSGFREAIVDFNYEGYTIPKGWKLLWSTASTHSDPSLFPRASEFDASRFEGMGPIPFSYVPFGGGPRMCAGKEYARLEILVFMHNIVKKFKWELLFPDEKIVYDPMATPAEGLPIRLSPRDSQNLYEK
ncbi:hypothetical protein Nepgr_025948 [Nepenthes gracilis]|uniref:beta-amyrin 28-monooxygenase n=1 Tax=Nepenthes gracilis TaxID=150966 RepID=A0AAD3Y1L2_NEPGR|nr:hypothetical protein Nepgr_025948 [Nepenthes gracilis]